MEKLKNFLSNPPYWFKVTASCLGVAAIFVGVILLVTLTA